MKTFQASPNATQTNANATNSSDLLIFQEDESGGNLDLIWGRKKGREFKKRCSQDPRNRESDDFDLIWGRDKGDVGLTSTEQ